MTIQWRDTPERYGLISRTLHWGMALVFTWQFLGMIGREVLGRTPLVSAVASTHSSVGTLLFVLIVVRLLWAMISDSRRPAYQTGILGFFAKIGHWSLYALMFIVPLLALVRSYGSGKGLSPFGFELFTATGVQIPWLTAPGNALHGLLAWVLLALIAGHVFMVLFHRYIMRDEIAGRMLASKS